MEEQHRERLCHLHELHRASANGSGLCEPWTSFSFGSNRGKKKKSKSRKENALQTPFFERQLSLKGLQILFCLVFPINEKENTAGWTENSGKLYVGSSCQPSDGKGGLSVCNLVL